jgi:RNA polymerase sigma factor (sigma-70 family)
MLKEKTISDAQLSESSGKISPDMVIEGEIDLSLEYQNRFPTREEETSLINNIQGRYKEILKELSNAPGIIHSLVHAVNCIEEHQLSLSVFMDRGERTSKALETDFSKLSEQVVGLQNVWIQSHDDIKRLCQPGDFDNLGAIDLLDRHAQIELESKKLMAEFKFSTAIVDCMAPHYAKCEYQNKDSIFVSRKIEELFSNVVPLRDLLFRLQEGNLVNYVSGIAPYRGVIKAGGVNFQDLSQEARLVLNTALHRFDTSRGVKFNAFAANWIGSAVYNDLYKNSSIIKVPVGAQKTLFKMERDGTSLEEAVKESNEPLDLLKKAQKALSSISLDNSDNSNTEDSLKYKLAYDEDPLYESDIQVVADFRKQVFNSLETILDPRSHDILISRFGLSGAEPQSLKDLALKYGICTNRVSQIEKAAIKKVRELLPEFESKVFL